MTGGTPQVEVMADELMEELEMVKAMNEILQSYLSHVQVMKADFTAMHMNLSNMARVNQIWINNVLADDEE